MPPQIKYKRAQIRPHFDSAPKPLTPAEVSDALRFIPSRPPREEWIKISSAVFAAIGEHEGCAALSAWSPEEKPGEYAALFRNRLRKVGAGTLVYRAKTNGWSRKWSNFSPNSATGLRKNAPRPASRNVAPKARAQLPPLTEPCVECLDAARLHRHLGPAWTGMGIAMNRKLLFAGTWRNTPALFVTDGAHQSCMIRRADFKSWETRDGIRKSDTPGGWGMTWPVGAHALSGELKDARLVILTEGFWDFLAAFVAAFAHYGSEASMRHVCIAAMSTGSPAIAESALPLFAGRHVRIIFHAGDKGRDGKPDLYDAKGEGTGYRAALKWRDQLVSAGATVDAMHLADIQELQGKGDLNDAVSAAFAATPEHRTPALFGALFADFPARP